MADVLNDALLPGEYFLDKALCVTSGRLRDRRSRLARPLACGLWYLYPASLRRVCLLLQEALALGG